MKLALVVDQFSEKTGYTENCLPRFLTKLGVDVHIITPNVKPYFDNPWYKETYERFYGPPIVEPGVSEFDGVTLHRLPHKMRFGYVEAENLMQTVQSIKPDIVQCLACMSWNALKLAAARPTGGYRLFTGNHMMLSVFRPLRTKMSFFHRSWFRASRYCIGSAIALATERCFPTSQEGADLCVRYYGIPKRKVVVIPLGVDTDRFHPCDSEDDFLRRRQERRNLLCSDQEILCIYTGRFTDAKNPLILAKAVDSLYREGLPFRALFVGAGPQRDAIASCSGCTIRDYVAWSDLCEIYRASDIAIWPQEESMSALDAAASGLPVVLSDRIKVVERVEGNGRTYSHGSVNSLCVVLKELADEAVRKGLGKAGVKKMRKEYSWEKQAETRLLYYRSALGGLGREGTIT